MCEHDVILHNMENMLLFDLRETQPTGNTLRHGGGIYGEIVFFRMLDIGYKFSCVYDSRIWINPKVKNACIQYDLPLYDYAQNNLNDIVQQNGIERIYSPVFNNRLYNVDCDVYYTLHGIRGIELPADWFMLRYKFSLKQFVKICLKKLFPNLWLQCKIKKLSPMVSRDNFRFVTVSNHSKYSILSYFPFISESQIKVFYSPDTTKNSKKLIPQKGNYYLLVSGNRWGKNNLRAIMALDSLFSDGRVQEHKVIVTGLKSPTFHYTIKNPEHFLFLGYVDDERLNELYANCFALIYPSLNEGFGYPPLEAMRYGKPVLASPFTSIAEVCSDGASFFNPYDIYEIKSRILSLDDEKLYMFFSEKAAKRFDFVRKKQDKDLDGLIEFITQ